MRRWSTSEKTFARRFATLVQRLDDAEDPEVVHVVRGILSDVRRRGDAAVVTATEKHDRWRPRRAADLEVPRAEIDAALASVPRKVAAALKLAHKRVADFHRRQKEAPVAFRDADGNRLEQRVTPLSRVGVYVPGGTARYPSSVLMTAVPARCAGVGEIVMVTPTPGGDLDPVLLAAAKVAGVDRVFRIGGAQAVAALAYGTKTVPAVDKIVGPGNVWVAVAKRLVRGRVDTDMEAGPSEVMILADASADPGLVAADLLAQAEHDPAAVPVLVTDDPALCDAALAEVERQVRDLPRSGIARQSLERKGVAIVARDMDEAVDLANAFAPEHLELLVKRPRSLVSRLETAGAIFVGPHTPEAVGDYVAGPSHVLPTAGTARFASPLGVHHFLRRTSVLEFSREGLEAVADAVETLAEVEGLDAHARSVAMRRR